MDKTKPVTTRLSEKDCAALARIAAREDRSVGYVIRRFVREGIERDTVAAYHFSFDGPPPKGIVLGHDGTMRATANAPIGKQACRVRVTERAAKAQGR